MLFDSLDLKGVQIEQIDATEKIRNLHNAFSSRIVPAEGKYQNADSTTVNNICRFLGVSDAASVQQIFPSILDSTKQMLNGVEKNGYKTLGLRDIASYKINPEYQAQNIKQQAGFAAEVISTWKENLVAQASGSEIRTFRADDLPEIFSKNDQYVDKVRMDPNGNIIERIQTKFVGKNGAEWVSKMTSKKFDKYLSDGKVDKLECPNDYYDDVCKEISNERESYLKQLERVTADGKTDVAASIQNKIDKLNKLEEMTEKSTVTSKEAIFAREHPDAYAASVFAKETLAQSNAEGLKSGAFAAGLTCVVSTVEDISDYLNGEMTLKDMTIDIAKDTAVAGALGYGTAFISTAVAQTMKESSCQLIQNMGGSCLPGAAVSFCVESIDDIVDFAEGKIDGSELAFNLGENAATISGSLAGAKLGAMVGSVAGPAGTVIGGIVGGTVGCVVASGIYETAVEYGEKAVDVIADKAVEYANQTVEAVSAFVPEAVESVKAAFGSFLGSVGISF